MVVEADVGDLGQHLDSMTCLLTLYLCLLFFFGNQYRTCSQGDRCGHQENGSSRDRCLVCLAQRKTRVVQGSAKACTGSSARYL